MFYGTWIYNSSLETIKGFETTDLFAAFFWKIYKSSNHLAKLSYFTNLDFPEIRGCPFLFPTFWGPVRSCEVAMKFDHIWPESSTLRSESFLKFTGPANVQAIKVSQKIRWREIIWIVTKRNLSYQKYSFSHNHGWVENGIRVER